MKGIGGSSKQSRQTPEMTEQVQKTRLWGQFRTQAHHCYRRKLGDMLLLSEVAQQEQWEAANVELCQGVVVLGHQALTLEHFDYCDGRLLVIPFQSLTAIEVRDCTFPGGSPQT